MHQIDQRIPPYSSGGASVAQRRRVDCCAVLGGSHEPDGVTGTQPECQPQRTAHTHTHTHTHTRTHARTHARTRARLTALFRDYPEARDSEWQWHLAPDRQPRQHPTTQFSTGRMPFRPPNQQPQSSEGITTGSSWKKTAPTMTDRSALLRWLLRRPRLLFQPATQTHCHIIPANRKTCLIVGLVVV